MNGLFRQLTYLLIFATGAAGLIYQVVWQRYLSRLMGSESMATAVILAVFLGGLSLGYLICGKLTTRFSNSFRGYALLELIIGVWCLVFPQLFSMVESLTRSWSFEPPASMILLGGFCAALLMGVPTLCMGGTVPFLTRGFSESLSDATRVHASVYAINTLGAFAGTLAAGFFLIQKFGLPGTMRWAAVLNLAAALYFFGLSRITKMSSEPAASCAVDATQTPNSKEAITHFPPILLYGIAFLSGFYVMTLENILIRITNLSIGSSSYSFSLIVAVFVLCIAVGSYVVGRKKHFSRSLLFYNQLALGLCLALVFITLDKWPYFSHLIRIGFQSNMAGFWFYQGGVLLALLLVLGLPVALIGATVPLAFHELKRELPMVGLHSGKLFSWNAIGCMLGSIGGGLILYYFLNNNHIFLIALVLVACSAFLSALPLSTIHRVGAGVFLIAVLGFSFVKPFYVGERFAFGTYRLRTPMFVSFSGPKLFYEEFYRPRKVLFYKDGPSGTVSVIENLKQPGISNPVEPGSPFPFPPMQEKPTEPVSEAKALSIIVNGKSDSNVIHDGETLKLLAHIPALWAEKKENVIIVGLGTGVTPGQFSLYPDVKKIVVAEISPTVVSALPQFAEATHEIYKNPRFEARIGDAFRVLGRSSEKWDIIVSEPSNPWVTGVDQLFTREFYRMAKSRLTENGIFMQWVQQYSINTEIFGIILTTLREEFKNCYMFQGTDGDLLILATPKPLTKADRARAEEALKANEAVKKSLAEIKITSTADILERERPGLTMLTKELSMFGIETQDRPRIHYLAGQTMFTGESMGDEVVTPGGGQKVIISKKLLESNLRKPEARTNQFPILPGEK